MDRAEVLHAPRYDISGSWKNIPVKNDQVLFMRKFNFSTEKVYIVCALLATQHAHCHKEYYSPRGQAVSTSHVLGGDSRQRSKFAILSTISSQQRRVFSKFHGIRAPRLHHGGTLIWFKLFPQPMDRAEVLHAPSYDLNGRRKNTPGENELVLS